jgi:DNA replication protein DnaC
MFTSEDYEKFRALRITHVATRFEELIRDEGNDELTPEQLFLTAVDDALDQRRANRIDKLIRQAKFPIPTATIAELDYREGRGINPTRMRRYGNHDWRSEPTNLLITSPTGGGKTYLVCAIGIAACHREHDVIYLRMDDLSRKLVIARTNREHRLPTLIASQSGPDYWAQALPDRVAADSIVNRLANNARRINLGEVDMRRKRGQQARAAKGYWE